MNIPLGTPICLKAHTGNNLQNAFFWRNGCCNNKNTGAWEQMVLIQTPDNKIIIQSRWNCRNLQVQKSGSCVFANHNQDLWEKFEVESQEDGKVFFISCHTGNVMQCDENGYARCVSTERGMKEAWTIVNPQNTAIMNSTPLRVAASAVCGAAMFPLVGFAAGAMIPAAMSSFGTVIAGVGTFHAPLTAGGCAAILQASSAALVSVKAAAAGSAVGATLSAFLGKWM